MRQAAYAAIAYAVNERRMESRAQTTRKVMQLTADLVTVFAHEDPSFDSAAFYRHCGFDAADLAEVEAGTRMVPLGMLEQRSAADPGEHETHQGYKNYETFVICSWLDNDQGLQEESAMRALEAADGEEIPDAAAATALREWIEEEHFTDSRGEEADDVFTGPAGSLLNSALSEVDWLEVAQTRLQFAAEQGMTPDKTEDDGN